MEIPERTQTLLEADRGGGGWALMKIQGQTGKSGLYPEVNEGLMFSVGARPLQTVRDVKAKIF